MHIYNRIITWHPRLDRRRAAVVTLTVAVVMALVDPFVPRWVHGALTAILAILAYLGKLEERDTMCEGPHPYIPVVQVAKVELVYEVLDQIVENVLHFSKVTPWTVSDLLILGSEVKDSWASNLRNNQSTDAILNKIRLTDLTTETSASVEYVTGLPMAGTIGNGVENGAQTIATKFTTDGRGRSRRGRVYNIGIPDNAVTNNRITDAYAQDLTDGWEAFRSDILGGTSAAIMVVVSLCQGKAWLEEGEAYAITGTSTDVWVDSQRRRLHGRGQ